MATGSMGYRVGRAIGSMPRGLRLGLLGAIVGAGILSYWTNKIASDQAEAAAARVATQAAQERQAQAQLAAAQRKAMIERCTGQRASIVAASNSALSRGALADAMDGIRQCVDALPLDAGYRDQFRLVDIAVKRQAEKDRALVAAVRAEGLPIDPLLARYGGQCDGFRGWIDHHAQRGEVWIDPFLRALTRLCDRWGDPDPSAGGGAAA